MNQVHISPQHPSKLLDNLCAVDLDKIKVVIIAQDPYPSPEIPTGIPFASEKEIQPSLAVLLKEAIRTECDENYEEYYNKVSKIFDPTLKFWTDQGVLLINYALTCEAYKPGTHLTIWRKFTSELLRKLNIIKFDPVEGGDPIVFAFLGKMASSLTISINPRLNEIISEVHPAAETYGGKFIGCGVFSEINKRLKNHKIEPIKWIPNL